MADPKLDLFFPDTHNRFLIGVMDSSFYPDYFNFINPTIEITPPGFNKTVMPFATRGLTLYNSNNLNLTCISGDCDLFELPDGVWTFKYTVAPAQDYFVEKTFLRIDNLKRLFDKAFLRINLSECDNGIKEQDMEKLDEINFYINTAIAEANNCNNVKAMKLYQVAYKLLNNFLKTK